MKRSSLILFFTILMCFACQARSQTRLFNLSDDGQWQKGDNTHRLSQYQKILPDGRNFVSLCTATF